MSNPKKVNSCPICKNEAEVWVEFIPYETKYGHDEMNKYHCGCKNCRKSTSILWEKRYAIDLWNLYTSLFEEGITEEERSRRFKEFTFIGLLRGLEVSF